MYKLPTRCTNYPKFYFVTKVYMFRASSVSIIRSYQLYTWQLVCFMQVTWPLPSSGHITPDDGHSRCPKHLEFCDKIKFWILDISCWLFIRRLEVMSCACTQNYFEQHDNGICRQAFIKLPNCSREICEIESCIHSCHNLEQMMAELF